MAENALEDAFCFSPKVLNILGSPCILSLFGLERLLVSVGTPVSGVSAALRRVLSSMLKRA